MTDKKKNIRSLSQEEMKVALIEMGEKPFRAKQIHEWLWQKNAASFEEMSNLGKALRERLAEHFLIERIELKDQQISSDKTIKCAFTTYDNRVVEGVLIPTRTRTTACISSQVGCSLNAFLIVLSVLICSSATVTAGISKCISKSDRRLLERLLILSKDLALFFHSHS